MSDESIKGPATSNDSLAPALSYISVKTRVKFDGGCLKQDKIIFNHVEIINIYSVYEINFLDRGYGDYFVLENSLLVAVRLVKIADIDKYKYSGHGIGFDSRGTFLVPAGSGRNIAIFFVDMSSSIHMDNKGKVFQF